MSLATRRTYRTAVTLTALAALVAGARVSAQQDDATAAARHTSIQTAIYPVMMKAVEAGDFNQARTLCEHAILMEPRDPVHRYNLACIEARAGANLPRALAALEQAVQLGFNDRNSLQNDPDLAAIRGDAKFQTIVARLGGAAAPPPSLPGFEPAPVRITPTTPTPKIATAAATPPVAKPAPIAAAKTNAAAAERPAPTGFKDGLPVGLFFMTRYWFGTGSLEKAAWYFAPDHTAYEKLETGFSAADLAAHAGRKGTMRAAGDTLEITWADGKKTASKVERDNDAVSFAWDMGIFTPVKPIERAADIVGVYEGGESVTFSGSHASIAKGLELRADGTFRWSGVAAFSSRGDGSRATAGSSNDSTGTWRAESYSLILTDSTGKVTRGIAFPYKDDDKLPKPNRLFFLGTMYKRQP